MSELVSLTRQGPVAVITVDNPPVNALSPGVPEGIREAIGKAQQDGEVQAIVLIGAGRTFIAGADIREFGKITSGERPRDLNLHEAIEAIENCPKPVVAAIHGTALGGGLEVAMGCHYRVALESAQAGQPEVKLGIIPGAGGTQRLPRLAGAAKAAAMCSLGDPVKAPEALQDGILDRIVPGTGQSELLAGAIEFANEAARNGEPLPRTSGRNEKVTGGGFAGVLAAARETAGKKFRGLMAAQKAIDAVEAATLLPFEEGVKKEAELFNECLFSDQSKAMIHVFFAERGVRKIPDIPKDTPLIEVKKAAVAGAGTMGGGIAMVFANAGLPVVVKEVSQEALDKGLATIRSNYERSVRRGRLSQEAMEQRMGRIRPALDFKDFAEAGIVVEAVFEDMELKKQVFAELDRAAKPEAILATNTSSLDIDEIASAVKDPSRVIGTHFFSPANVMRLLEVVRGKQTSKSAVASCMGLGRRLGKVAVLAGNCPGFVGNRMFAPYRREAQFLVEEGASVAAVDEALYEFGMAMGPLATGDLAGLDVGWRIRKAHRHLEPEGARQPLVEDRLCEMGCYGQKTGKGWYVYDENRNRTVNAEAERLARELARQAGIEQREIPREEIVDRTVYALVNEGARILEEGYALRAADIDIVYVYGYGFPAYRGGPMWYADTVGLGAVLKRVREFEQRHGFWWRPAPLLVELAEQGKSFAEWDRGRG